MFNLNDYIFDFMKNNDCSKCDYNKDLCPEMFKKENETPCVFIHKYLEFKEAEYNFNKN